MLPRLSHSRLRPVSLALAAVFVIAIAVADARAQSIDPNDPIGLNALRSRFPSLTGAGVRVAQPEAPETQGGMNFEVNPAATGQPTSLFTYLSIGGTTGTFNNGVVGTESGHADQVGNLFYGTSAGVAPGVAHVDNYEANFFINNVLNSQTAITDPIVNQSFVSSNTQQTLVDQRYDNYVARYGTIFLSGVGNLSMPGNTGTVITPSTAYNVIAVAAYSVATSSRSDSLAGPTPDGRAKPDITAPQGETSFSTALVSGVTTLLYQAALRGDGGTGTAAAATNVLTIKSLLLTGARKPADWVHTPTQPLDYRYGAGVVNANDSYNVLSGGQRAATTTNQFNAPAPKGPLPIPTGTFTPEPFQFFNLTTLTDPSPVLTTTNSADHYFFTLAPSATPYVFTATLTWNRQLNQTTINDLDLYLLNRANSAAVASSVSTIDNVEHIFVPTLVAGNYDLQVQKVSAGRVSQGETYAISVSIVPEPNGAFLLVFAGWSLLAFVRPRAARFSRS